MTSFECTICGKSHDLLDLTLGADAPALWHALSEAEMAESELTEEQCFIVRDDGDMQGYVRACLDVPILGSEHAFTWGVWVEVANDDFDAISDHWEDPARTTLGPYAGQLATPVPGYRDTLRLAVRLRQREVGLRPLVETGASEHPLAQHQRVGVEASWLGAVVAQFFHD